MKYTILINQLVFTRLFPGLDIVDAAIFDYVSTFFLSSRIEKMKDEHGTWYWVEYSKVADDMPMLGIKSRDGIYRRIRKLIDAGILELHPGNSKNQKTYMRPGPRFDDAHYLPPDENSNPRINIRPSPGRPSEPPSDIHPADKTIKDETITDKKGQTDLIEPEEHPLVQHIEAKYKRVAKMREPLTSEQAVKIMKDYRAKYPGLFPTDGPLKRAIDTCLQELNDHVNSTKKFSANRNLRTFLTNHIDWKLLTPDEGGKAKKPKERTYTIEEANALYMNNFSGTNSTGTQFKDIFEKVSGEGKNSRYKLDEKYVPQVKKWRFS